MKHMKKFLALLLALTMVLSLAGTAFAASKITKKSVKSGQFVQFKGSVYGYDKARVSSKTNIIVRKGSVGLAVDMSKNGKWVKVIVTDPEMNLQDKEKTLWFGVDRLKGLDSGSIHCIFSSGGSNLSLPEGSILDDGPTGKVKVTHKSNLRKTASLKGKSQGVVKVGKKLTLTGKYGIDSRGVCFFQVKYDGKKVFISQMDTNKKNWVPDIVGE